VVECDFYKGEMLCVLLFLSIILVVIAISFVFVLLDFIGLYLMVIW